LRPISFVPRSCTARSIDFAASSSIEPSLFSSLPLASGDPSAQRLNAEKIAANDPRA
jgi:hypothetical protein